MTDISKSSKPIWDKIIEERMDIPTPYLQLYNSSGTPVKDTTGSKNNEHHESYVLDSNVDNQVENESNSGSDEQENIEQLDILDETENTTDPADQEQQITQRTVQFHTTHATEISKVLGNTEEAELKEFDTLRYRLKHKDKCTREEKRRHQCLLYKLQLAVQHKRTVLLKQLQSIEKLFLLHHCRLPQPHECADQDIMTQCRHINKLLRAWNKHETD